MCVYQFQVKDNKGNAVSMENFESKVLLIVNTATKCGLTPQYEALEAIYKKYKDQGLEILDFPSNQFLEQAPGTDQEIDSFCTLTYHTTFPRFSKVDVNGENTAPLFQWLKEQAPADIGDQDSAAFEAKVKELVAPKADSDIKWNFGKFLLSRKGEVVARFSPAYDPAKVEAAIAEELAK